MLQHQPPLFYVTVLDRDSALPDARPHPAFKQYLSYPVLALFPDPSEFLVLIIPDDNLRLRWIGPAACRLADDSLMLAKHRPQPKRSNP